MGSDHSRINEFGFRAYTIRRLLTKVSLSPKESYHGTGYRELLSNVFNPWLVSPRC